MAVVDLREVVSGRNVSFLKPFDLAKKNVGFLRLVIKTVLEKNNG